MALARMWRRWCFGIIALLISLSGAGPLAAQESTPNASPSPTTAASDWPTYHRDNARTGFVPGLPDPQHLAKAWSAELDGAVYAEPLVVGDWVIVATEGDSLYALDAATGDVQWKVNAGEPVPQSDLPCGNIDPLGITGTPVYDPATGLVFAVAEVRGDNGPAHLLLGVDVATGDVRVRRSADPPRIKPEAHQQRGALTLSQGKVYIAYGGLFGDCGDYHGTVVATRTDGQGELLVFQVPTSREGGIWAPPGPVVDDQGNLFVSVGNGEATEGDWDHSDSVLRLSPDLKLQDGFAPNEWPDDNASDADLGSLGPVLLPDGLIFIAGKSGTGYLLYADALGGVGGQAAAAPVCAAFGGAAVVASRIILPCTDGLREVEVGPGATFTLGWQASGGVDGSPVVGGQTVYATGSGGTLYALNLEDGSVRAQVEVGTVSRFATPTLAGGRIFLGTMTGVVALTGS
ncbi:MAG: PQQ-binding-like beta-propeller repeat protein [Thermomicrobiales bacterium]